jgi:hypothetical protein
VNVTGTPLLRASVLSLQFNIFDTCEFIETSPGDDIFGLMFPVKEAKAAELFSIRIGIISFLTEHYLHNEIHPPLNTGFLSRETGFT